MDAPLGCGVRLDRPSKAYSNAENASFFSCHESRVPHISLVFREMWDTTKVSFSLCVLKYFQLRAVESHISRKTTEMWGTRDSWLVREVILEFHYTTFT
jgi:hypothetical protein